MVAPDDDDDAIVIPVKDVLGGQPALEDGLGRTECAG
jgi:hypothetical protein